MMTRKHYRDTAEAIRRANVNAGNRNATRALREMADEMAHIFAADNPRFNATTFSEAIFGDDTPNWMKW